MRKERAAALLARGKKHGAIADELGISARSVKRYAARDPEVQEMCRERQQRAINESDVKSTEVIGILAGQMRGDVTDAFESGASPLMDRLKANRLGHLIKSITIRREVSETGVFDVERIEFHSSQSAAIQLCRVLGINQNSAKNLSDPDYLRTMLDERVAQSLEVFRKLGVVIGSSKVLTRRDVLQLYALAPEEAGYLLPLILAELTDLELEELASEEIQ